MRRATENRLTFLSCQSQDLVKHCFGKEARRDRLASLDGGHSLIRLTGRGSSGSMKNPASWDRRGQENLRHVWSSKRTGGHQGSESADTPDLGERAIIEVILRQPTSPSPIAHRS